MKPERIRNYWNAQSKQRLMWALLIVVALLAMWIDNAHPFPVHVIRNGHQRALTAEVRGSHQSSPR